MTSGPWMGADLQARLSALPPLRRAHAWIDLPACKICGHTAPFFDVVDFQKRPSGYPFGASGVGVPYFRCLVCGFLFTPFCDTWSKEDFARYIYNSDYRLVDTEYGEARPTRTAEQISRLLANHTDAAILDYGSGTGIFAAKMNEKGFRATAYDPFSAPERPAGRFPIITCFAVVEHSAHPLETFGEMAALLDEDGFMIIGQPFQPPDIDTLRCNWWYISPRNGHVSAYTDQAFAFLARKNGWTFYRGKAAWHVFTKGEPGRWHELAKRLGHPWHSFALGASQDGPFLPPEGPEAERFQWTNDRTVTWHRRVAAIPDLTCQVAIPFAREPRQGFAKECNIVVNETAFPVEVRNSTLFAEAPLGDTRDVTVMLQMPELVAIGNHQVGLGLRVLSSAYAAG